MVETRIDVLVFAHGPHLRSALTAHGIQTIIAGIVLDALLDYYMGHFPQIFIQLDTDNVAAEEHTLAIINAT